MIFLDTSALVKRYVRELHSDWLASLMDEDLQWTACAVAAIETRATLCSRFADAERRDDARLKFDADWASVSVVSVDDGIVTRAGEIGCRFATRTLDSIHLAAAERLPAGLTFVTFDARQAAAARMLGFSVAP